MRFDRLEPPRTFVVGFGPQVTLKDCGRLALAPDEQITCVTDTGAEYDVLRKDWGFYASPSINGRLARFGLRGVLVLNRLEQIFLLLVERGQEPSFGRYVADEGLQVLHWLDDAESVRRLAQMSPQMPARMSDGRGGGPAGMAGGTPVTLGCPCGEDHFEPCLAYDAPPPGEARFDLRGAPYRREYRRCTVCGHMAGRHGIDLDALYGGAYLDATYGSPAGLRRTFERIVALPPGQSDNAGRVRRIVAFARGLGIQAEGSGSPPSILDVGAGLGVFPWAIGREGWACTALDPDPRATAHLRDVVGCAALCGDFRTLDPRTAGGPFDAVTFNKVLEHVAAPADLLAHARKFLKPAGFVYIELPDAAALADGKDREEFFIEHHHVFSPASLALLAGHAGFAPLAIERLREPSGKYTLRAFLAVAGSPPEEVPQ